MTKQQHYAEPTALPEQLPMTTAEVARALGTTIDVARSVMRTKKMRAFKAGGQWRAYPRDVATYICEQLEIQK